MVTSDLLRIACEAIVDAYKPHLTFILDTQPIKDRSSNARPPLCLWVEPEPQMVQTAEILQDGWTLDLTFLEQTAKDRTALELSDAYAKTEAIAKHFMRRFFDRYIASINEVQGTELDMVLSGPVTFPKRIFDDETTNMTGTGVRFTVVSRSAPDCVDDYFA